MPNSSFAQVKLHVSAFSFPDMTALHSDPLGCPCSTGLQQVSGEQDLAKLAELSGLDASKVPE